MSSTTPIVFRASEAQRAVAAVLFFGCVLVVGLGIPQIVQNLPRIWYQLKLAQNHGGEPIAMIWLSIILACSAVLIAGAVLTLAVLILALILGTQVLVDEFGICVECTLLPMPLARKFGAGHIQWKNITKIERRGISFVLHGCIDPDIPKNRKIVRFFVVDQMDHLILLVIERSPNINLSS